MLLEKINTYLEQSSEQSSFKINIEENGGYIKFSNSGQRGGRKFFTLGLHAIATMLRDIKDNINIFQQHEEYVESQWRDLSQYYTDETIQTIATVQTKPLFVTVSKLINWANDINENDENHIELSIDAIENTIKLIDELILLFTPSDHREKNKQKFSTTPLGSIIFSYKNLLFKGVPGTGKSRAIDNIIKDELDMENQKENILRINIHSASSNADLMQGIGIATSNGQIEYKEKQGLIYDLIKRAIYHPNQPFVLILEEIQENSLNELIGDLIYLIEDEKRANLKDLADNEEYGYQELIEKVLKEDTNIHYVKIPYLVSSSTEYRKMILPDNLYIFCTSNYRDDKKVIEDNLLRRFEVIEIYPKNEVASEYAREFFESLNESIQKTFSVEIHPDRYMIGHAIWKDVDDEKKFYRAFLKVVTEFKDIKEIEYETFKEVLNGVKLPENIDEEIVKQQNYYQLIDMLQTKIGYGFTD